MHEQDLILATQKLDLFVSKGHSHIESSHNLHQIDESGWVGLTLWCYNLTHEILVFVETLISFKKYIRLNKVKHENS